MAATLHQGMEKVRLSGNQAHGEEELRTDAETDTEVGLTPSARLPALGDYHPTPDSQQLGRHNPFLPPPPYNQLDVAQTAYRQRSMRLGKPIAIPATSHKLGSAFLRAYAPVLERYHISAELFLTFIDELNRAMVQSPPFQVLGAAGQIIGFVPIGHGLNSAIGAGLQFGARVGAVAVSKGRTELKMREANQSIFGPRGLKCEIAKLDAVAKIAGIPILDEYGGISNMEAVFPRTGSDGSDEWRMEDGKIMIINRRLEPFKRYIAPLETENIPEMVNSDNLLGKWNALQSERDRKAEEKRIFKQAMKAASKRPDEGKAAHKYDRKIERMEKKIDRAVAKDGEDSRSARKERHKMEKELNKLESKHDKRLEKAEKKDERWTKVQKDATKGLWILIRELEAR